MARGKSLKLAPSPVTGWLYDFDGVLTKPEPNCAVDAAIIDFLVAQLEANEPVGLNTGRSLVFIGDQFLQHVERAVSDPILLRNLFVVAEKGGTWLRYTADGTRQRYREDQFSILGVAGLFEDVKRFVDETIPQLTVVDETKETLITTEMAAGTSLAEYREMQERVATAFQEILTMRGLDHRMRVDRTQIAVDIEWLAAGKALGADRFLSWLEERQSTPARIIAFGDSPSDFDMAIEIAKHNIDIHFIYVGPKQTIEARMRQTTIPLHIPSQLFADGTLEVLRQLQSGAGF